MKRNIFLILFFLFGQLGLKSAAFGAVDCATEVSSQSGLTRSGYRLNRRINQFVQTITIKNKGSATIQGPVNLVLENLSPSASLANSSGDVDCPSATVGKFVEIAAGEDNIFSPGETLNVVLRFANPTNANITYAARVFASTSTSQTISGVTINPDGFLTNQNTQITVRAPVAYTPGEVPPVVTLERLDANNNVIGTEGALVDTGDLNAGDEIEGDGVFSFRKNYLSTAKERIKLRVKATKSGSTILSQVLYLDSFIPFTDEDYSNIINLEQQAESSFNQIVGTQGRFAATQAALTFILSNSKVLQAGISDSSNGIWILYSNGMLGGLLLNDQDTLGGISSLSSGQTLQQANLNASGNIDVGKTKVLLMSPFLSSLSAIDVNPSLNTLYTNQTCPKYDVTFVSNAAVTVETFKTLSQYGVVNHYGHGDTYFGGMTEDWADFFGWFDGGSQVVILTGQQATNANKATYQIELDKGRLAIISGYYAILPSFISSHNGQFPDSLVFINTCRSSRNTSMANAFLNKGAKTYLGYSNYVKATFATERAKDFHNKWVLNPVNLVTTGDSFTPGLNDGQTPPANWEMLGANNLQLPSGELQNGDFETGTLGAWSASGDGRIITQLGTFAPTGGSYMGIVSTGLGFTTSSGAISQKVCLAKDTKTISFDWNFSSEEFREYCGSSYQDYFRVEAVTDSGTALLFNRKVDDICGGTFKVPFSFDRGDVWSYGWQNNAVDVSGIAAANTGKSITLRFSAGDVGDSIYDSAILLDNIKLNK